MTTFEFLNINRKVIDTLHRNGLISFIVISHQNIYSDYDILIKKGEKKDLAALRVAEMYNVSKQTVYLALKKMKKQIEP